MADETATSHLPVDRSTWAANLHERRKRHLKRSVPFRIAFGLAGVVVFVVGIFAIPLPGPGWAIVFVGLGMLALEFKWAETLAMLVLAGLQWFWEHWQAAPAWQKAIGFLLLLVIAAFAISLSATLIGSPDFVPKLW